MNATAEEPDPTEPRRVPSRRWYLLALVLMVGSVAVFAGAVISKAAYLADQIEPMPRFAAPTGETGFVVTIDTPGKQNLFYENRGTLGEQTFDTRRRQVWTTFDTPSMTCIVTHIRTGDRAEVRLPGVGETTDKREVTKDLVYTYNFAERQGHSAWVFEADKPGDYQIVLQYKDAVWLEPGDITLPKKLTSAEQKEMLSGAGKAHEEARREAIEQAALAELEPVDVLFAVGPDPTRGGFFALVGLKGAATVLAFGFTFSILITLVTYMLRNGHVTPRGEMSEVKRGILNSRS